MKPIIQSTIGYITLKESVSEGAAQSISGLVSKAIDDNIEKKLQNIERTREQIALVTAETVIRFFQLFVKCGYWEFIPSANCPKETIDFINS